MLILCLTNSVGFYVQLCYSASMIARFLPSVAQGLQFFGINFHIVGHMGSHL